MAAVSVVLTVHNDERHLPYALASIRSQTLQEWRMLAVDDGSTDRSGEILDRAAHEDGRINVIHKPQTGMGDSLRLGFERVETEYVARMDSDDLSTPTRLAVSLEYLQSRPAHVLVGTWAWFFTAEHGVFSGRVHPDDDGMLRDCMQRGYNPFIHGSVMVRMSAYREAVGYRASLRNASDFDLWLQLAEKGQIGVVPEFAYCYRFNPSGMSYARRGEQVAETRMAVRLARERMRHGRELTPLHRSRFMPREVGRSDRHRRAIEQLRHYIDGMIHWAAGFRASALRSFVSARGPNLLGLKAGWREMQVRYGWGKSAIAGLDEILRQVGREPSWLEPPYPWAWAAESFRAMETPLKPYLRDGASRGRIGEVSNGTRGMRALQ